MQHAPVCAVLRSLSIRPPPWDCECMPRTEQDFACPAALFYAAQVERLNLRDIRRLSGSQEMVSQGKGFGVRGSGFGKGGGR